MYRSFITAAALAVLAAGSSLLRAQTENPPAAEHRNQAAAKPYLGVAIEAHSRGSKLRESPSRR